MPAWGVPCGLAATATLYGTNDVATLAGEGISTRLIGIRQPQPYFTYRMMLPARLIGKRQPKDYARRPRVRTLGGSLRFEQFIDLMEVVDPLGSPV